MDNHQILPRLDNQKLDSLSPALRWIFVETPTKLNLFSIGYYSMDLIQK